MGISNFITEWGHIAGLSGLVLGGVLSIFRDVVKEKLLKPLPPKLAFKVIITLMLMIWSLAGYALFAYFNFDQQNVGAIPPETEASATIEIDLNKYEAAASHLSYSLSTAPAQFDEAKEYFFNENLEVNQRITQIQSLSGSITYLAAEAGYGKSWIGIGMIKRVVPDSVIAILDIKKDFVRPTQHALAQKGITKIAKSNLIVTDIPARQKLTINHLPSFKENTIQLLQLIDTTKKYIIIDGLDELHPNKVDKVLNEIESGIFPKKHLIVLARPEAFASRTVKSALDVTTIKMKPIALKSYADVRVRVDNWIQYYPNRSGTKKISKQDSIRISNQLINLIQARPFLKHSILNSSNGFDLVDWLSSNDINKLSSKSDIDVMDIFKEGIFARNTVTHNRPSSGDVNSTLYYHMIAKIALHYLDDLSEYGYFNVMPSQELVIDFDGRSYRFNVKSTLELSGIVDIIPVNSRYSQYRFQPFWLQEYFAEYGKRTILIKEK